MSESTTEQEAQQSEGEPEAEAERGDAGDLAAAAPGPARAADRVEPVDFSQPSKFTSELRRRIERLLIPFCRSTAGRLAAELKATVDVRQIQASQVSWSAARSLLGADSLVAGLEVRPAGRQMMMAVSLPFVLQALECLLGGSAAQAPDARRLTEIDWALTRRLLESITWQLSLAWRDLGGLELSLREVDSEGEAGLLVPIAEPTFAVTLECEIAGRSSQMALLVPWSAIEPVAGELLGGAGTPAQADPRDSAALRHSLAAANVLLRAEIGTRAMAVHDVLAIEPGALLSLRTRAERGVRLLAEDVCLARGEPGRSGVRRAVKLSSPIEPAAGAQSLELLASPARRRSVPATAEPRAALEQLRRLHGVDVRLWAELGRASMSLGRALALPQGTVLELEEQADDPVALFVNGLPFASGTLAVTGDGEWAVQVQTVR